MSAPANFNNQRPVINPADAVMLLIDHQSGLFQTIGDMPMPDLRRHATALAKIATLANMPVITTASVPQGPNGPLIPEIHANAPHAQYVARTGQINAWDNADFVQAVKATGKKQLIIASGTYSKMAQEITLARVVQAGAVPMDTGAVASEIQQTWNREDAAQWAEIYTLIFPSYQLLIESYNKAQDVITHHETLDSEK